MQNLLNEILSKQPIQESYIFSDKTLLIDKSNFKKNKVLIIIGISGSGKTTLGKKLAEKYNATFISTDDWFNNQYVNKEKLENPDKKDQVEIFNNKVRALEKEIFEKSKKGFVIAEGVHFGCDYENKIFSKDWSCKYAVITLRASLLRATYQRKKRNPKGKFYLKNNIRLINQVENWVKNRLKCAKEVEKFDNNTGTI